MDTLTIILLSVPITVAIAAILAEPSIVAELYAPASPRKTSR
jgi:hypothetical protein